MPRGTREGKGRDRTAEELAREHPPDEAVQEDRIDAYQLMAEVQRGLKKPGAALRQQLKAFDLAQE